MLDVKVVNENNSGAVDYKALAKQYLQSKETEEIKFPESFVIEFCQIADSMKLNPFLHELHAISYRNSKKNTNEYKCITGYQVYIKRADRSGKLDGWEVTSTGNGLNVVSTIVIYRKDWQKPFRHSARLRECAEIYQDGNLKGSWSKMPTFMCEKVAISQGFRLCFPDELAGMPYTQEELPEGDKIETASTASTTPESLGMQKASALPTPPQQNKTTDAEKLLKGGASTEEEKIEIKKLMDACLPDLTPMFTKEEKMKFASLRKETYTASELIEVMKIEIQKRFENAAVTMGKLEQ